MHKRTKALDIPKAVKDKVWERDGRCCVYCGTPQAMPNAHYIPRSHGGLGIEKNVVTLCHDCHMRYDNTVERPIIKDFLRQYLISHYPEWDEQNLIYRKWI